MQLGAAEASGSGQFTFDLNGRNRRPPRDAVNALLGYVIQPGTVFYAGVNNGWDQDLVTGARHATSQQVFAKASWRFAR